MTSAQICARAVAIAKFTGGPSIAGLLLNAVLQELCQTYDFEVCRGAYTTPFNPVGGGATSLFPNNVAGAGPFSLPTDYLRVSKDESFWFLNGVPYPMINVDMSKYDAQIQQQGFQSYPGIFATDMSTAPPTFVVWPPTAGAYPVLLRYFRRMADIGSNAATQGSWIPGSTAPESATVVPWFPSSTYLYTRLAGELMKDTSDTRYIEFLGNGDEEHPGLAAGILRRFLKMKDDSEDRPKTVTLSRERFRTSPGKLPDTKAVWG